MEDTTTATSDDAVDTQPSVVHLEKNVNNNDVGGEGGEEVLKEAENVITPADVTPIKDAGDLENPEKQSHELQQQETAEITDAINADNNQNIDQYVGIEQNAVSAAEQPPPLLLPEEEPQDIEMVDEDKDEKSVDMSETLKIEIKSKEEEEEDEQHVEVMGDTNGSEKLTLLVEEADGEHAAQYDVLINTLNASEEVEEDDEEEGGHIVHNQEMIVVGDGTTDGIALQNDGGVGTVDSIYVLGPDSDYPTNLIEATSGCGGGGGEVENDPDDPPPSIEVEVEEVVDEEDADTKEFVLEKKPKKPRGRKPIGTIPLYVLGRDITKPTEDNSNGGRRMPKPRLGVKLPYKNLTSQIVSKEEIQREIMDRSKQSQENSKDTTTDVLFARRLMQRLAKKISPSDPIATGKTTTNPSSTSANNKSINNSDLIAILEGDDAATITTQKGSHTKTKQNLGSQLEYDDAKKDIEKQIALQQLEELPLSPNDSSSSNSTPKAATRNSNTVMKNVQKNDTTQTSQSTKSASATRGGKKSGELEGGGTGAGGSGGGGDETHPKLKPELVVKTYTRKRKSYEIDANTPLKKLIKDESEEGLLRAQQQQQLGNNVYITKSSRVIKKKVIWDPDNKTKTPTPMKSVRRVERTSTRDVVEKAIEEVIHDEEEQEDEDAEEGVEEEEEETQAVEKKEQKKSSSSQSPQVGASPARKRKGLSEIDKLLMDEGAVNMLYDVKSTAASAGGGKKSMKTSVISLDRAHKDLLNKMNIVKNDLKKNTSGREREKSLRKKETTSPKKAASSDSPKQSAAKKAKDEQFNSPPTSPVSYQTAEASRIIRRHSSSSFSSASEDASFVAEKKTTPTTTPSTSTTPETTRRRSSRDSSKATKTTENPLDKKTFSTLTLTRTAGSGSVKIELNEDLLTEKVLAEITYCLNELALDSKCFVVLIATKQDDFCTGLGYKTLLHDDAVLRRKAAESLANCVEEFLDSMIQFPNTLIAGIKGKCTDFGTQILPVFDVIVASDSATFATNYTKIGAVPEGAFLYSKKWFYNKQLISKLFYLSHVLKSEELYNFGLITQVVSSERFDEDLEAIFKELSNHSGQSSATTKNQLRGDFLKNINSALASNSANLVQSWISEEFQTKFQEFQL